MVYLGFADGLFGLHHLRLNLGLFGSFGDFFCLCSAELWSVWCLFDCVLRFI